ncbi:phage tail tape measure protein [uncultured Draconibacterium sp.]|uniref:phage tail tape measure protein n=1 Tax=uncultured Draconibacterium sp. TaxID=1573823 RepID=UPI0025E7E75C|nr:phage tail tape measure protein [uncultured Draconibacterium sp.]
MSIGGGIQGLHFINTMSNADLKRKSAEAEGIIGGMGRNIGKLAPFAPLAAGSLILAKLGDDAYDFSNEFSKAMREVQTISQATQEDWEGMSKSIIDMAANGPDDAIQLAQAYYQIASAGYDGAAGLNLLDVSSRAATAGITDTKTAADGLTTILNAWGKDATEAEQVADVLFKTVEKGKVTFPELAQNIAQVAPMASAMKISLEEILGATASLTKQGNTTSMAMTQIRQAIIGLNENLGDGWSEAMTFQEALQAVRDMAGGSDTALKDMMGRIEGVNAVLALTGDKAIAAADDLKTLSEATGSMQTAYETMMLEADNKWSQVHNKWQRELSQVGDKLKITSSGLADFFNRILTDEQADVIGPASQSAINNLFSDLNQLDDKEAKLKLITDKIIELKNEYVSLGQESAQWEKVQPSWLQRQAENFNAALGFGPATLTGRYNQANLEIVQKDIAINQAVQKKLEEIYRQVLNSAGDSGSGGGGGDKPKPWTVGDSQAEIERLKEQLGTVSIEQEVELRFKIADEQAKVDEFYGKVRDRFNQAINESWEAPFNRTVGADGTNSETASKGNASKLIEDQTKAYKEQTKEITKQLKPMKQLTQEGAKQLENEHDKIDTQRTQADNNEQLVKGLQDSSQLLGALSFAIGEINTEAGEAVGRMADIAMNAANMAQNIVAGNWVGAISSGIGIIGNLFASWNESSESLAERQQRINEESLELNDILRERIRLLQQAGLISPSEAAIADLDELRDKLELSKNELDQYTHYVLQNGERTGVSIKEMMDTVYGGNWGVQELNEMLGGMDEFEKKYLELTGTVGYTYHPLSHLTFIDENAFNESVNSILQTAADIGTALQDRLGFDADTISGAIIDGLNEGYDSAVDFSDTFEDLMRQAMINSLQTKYLDGPVQAWSKYFAEFMDDGAIDPVEREKLQNGFTNDTGDWIQGWNQIIASMQQGTDLMEEATGIDLFGGSGDNTEALQGIQRSITEETGSLLVGQFSAMRESQVGMNETMMDQLGIAEEQLEMLQEIRDNTSYNHNLADIKQGIDDLNTNIKQGLSV